jgi:mannose-6-phosphate isomerase-like protein (cupin superfamily)
MTRSYWLFGARFIVHANHEDTAGRYDLIEGGGPPGFQSTLHRHNRYAEQFFILEGEFTVWAGEQTVVLHPGDTFTVPAGTAHTVAITGDRPGRALAASIPSGFARLIMEAGTPDTGDPPPTGQPDLALYARIEAEIGDETLGPPGARPATRILPKPEPVLVFADREQPEGPGFLPTILRPTRYFP